MKEIRLDGKGRIMAPDGYRAEEAEAWRRGFTSFIPMDQTVFNPYDPDTDPSLYDAWEAGFDAA